MKPSTMLPQNEMLLRKRFPAVLQRILDIGDRMPQDFYYEDSEDLVDHIKIIFRIDDDILENNEDYKFVTKIIGRSEPSFHYLA